MKRTLMQAYVKGSNQAVALYQEAFDAALVSSYLNPDGTYYHSELDVYGQILAVAEASPTQLAEEAGQVTGNIMQFCLDFGEDGEALLRKVYGVLKEGAKLLVPLAPCDYSPLMADFIDRFGVRWCFFV